MANIKASGSWATLSDVVRKYELALLRQMGPVDAVRLLTNVEMALALSGSEDKKSKAYKAAQRNVQRYKDGTRKPSKKTLEKIFPAVRDLLDTKPGKVARLAGPGVITISGSIGYSADVRKRIIQGSLGAEKMRDFLKAGADEDYGTAEDIVMAAYFKTPSGPGMTVADASATVYLDGEAA